MTFLVWEFLFAARVWMRGSVVGFGADGAGMWGLVGLPGKPGTTRICVVGAWWVDCECAFLSPLACLDLGALGWIGWWLLVCAFPRFTRLLLTPAVLGCPARWLAKEMSCADLPGLREWP